MKVFRGEDLFADGELCDLVAGGSAITIGNFDGVHIGHHAILGRLLERSKSLLVPSVVITFEPHPRKVLATPGALRLLIDYNQKIKLLEDLGMDILVNITFNREFAEQSPVEFIENWMLRLRPKAAVVGYDFNFGRGGSGTLEILREIGRMRGFDVEVVEAMRIDGMIVSSSRIRNLVEAGEITRAAALLGRPYAVTGTVIKGHGRGRKLGFPTANVRSEAEILPADGVYAGEFVIDGQAHAAMVNLGTNPTFGDASRSLEACILNFSRDIYGENVEVRFMERVRQEIKFKGPDELINQIKRDRAFIEEYFRDRASGNGSNSG